MFCDCMRGQKEDSEDEKDESFNMDIESEPESTSESSLNSETGITAVNQCFLKTKG